MGSGLRQSVVHLRFVVGVLFLVFVMNYVLQSIAISTPFTRNYLDDLLAMPLIFYLTQTLMRLIYRDKHFKLDVPMLILGFLMVSIGFEWLLPKYIEHLTADNWDVLCYAIGTIFFYILNRMGA